MQQEKKKILLNNYFYSLKKKRKKVSMQILQRFLNFKFTNSVNLEMITNRIYFNDYKSAIERLKLITQKDLNIEKIELMLNLKCKLKNKKEIIFDILNYLRKKFDINLFYLLSKICKKSDINFKKEIFFIKSKEYINKLNIKECLFLKEYFINDYLRKRMMICYPLVYDFTEEYFKRNPEDIKLKEYLFNKINYIPGEGIIKKKKEKLKSKFELFKGLKKISNRDFCIARKEKIN